jgi:hypothetical protein
MMANPTIIAGRLFSCHPVVLFSTVQEVAHGEKRTLSTFRLSIARRAAAPFAASDPESGPEQVSEERSESCQLLNVNS